VWTGSWNLTENGTDRNDNNAVRVVSSRLASNYGVEFEEMFSARAFGPESPSDTPYPLVMLAAPGDQQPIQVRTAFAPEDGVMDQVLALVQGARESIQFLAFSFTDDRLGRLLVEKNRASVVVQGVMEAHGSEREYSEYGRLANASPPVDLLLDGNPAFMHHKAIVIDGSIVILGSFNFTQSADQANDENVLVVADPGVAARYQAEFERVYAQAEGGQ
jgi:phosphatidylserine/phosphatidylglycerophosphate/cardiolipin synthase-like enzyme